MMSYDWKDAILVRRGWWIIGCDQFGVDHVYGNCTSAGCDGEDGGAGVEVEI
jgi:hypothetical protein